MDNPEDSVAGTVRLVRRGLLAAALGGMGVLALRPTRAAADDDGISHSAESIHQEPLIAARRDRVYAALTDAAQFERLTQFSDAVKTMPLRHDPARIEPRAGGVFALFGGYISGRFIELVANELLVQAWRVGNWDRGVYSIARFQLEEQGADTRIVFDHAGFPLGAAGHLALGWQKNYWDPLRRLLA
ncbi:MAG TPA: SRPBCC domain-containing protein [Steroidobacteraceae bacterium]|nr:SRPBCC domain-containing protein [Steroidobacteraceae bacterium]